MALFSRQFENIFDLVEVVQCSVVFSSTAAGASTVVTGVVPITGQASQANIGDVVLISTPVNEAGAVVSASATSLGTFAVSVFNPTGGSLYNPGTVTCTFYVFRSSFKGAS